MTDARPRREAGAELTDVDAQLELGRFVALAPDPMALLDLSGVLLFANGAMCELLGWPLEALVGRPAHSLLTSADQRYARARDRHEFASPLDGPMGDTESVIAVRGDGAHIPLRLSIARMAAPFEGFVLATARDITLDLEIELRAAELAQLYAMMAAANGAILRSRTRSDVFDELCHVAATDGDFRMAWVAVGADDGRLVPVAAAGPALTDGFDGKRPLSAPIAETAWRTGELVVVHDIAHDPLTASYREMSVQHHTRSGCAIPIRCRGELVGVFSTYMERVGGYDSHRLQLLERLVDNVAFALEAIEDRLHKHQLAYRDPLTGLPNRTLLFDRITKAAETARPDHAIAVLLVDLDGFKDVNDALGHDVGDQLLIAVADRLRTTIRREDFVARLGGDEFAVLCTDVPGVDVPIDVAIAVADALKEPFELDDLQTFISSSIGITVRASRSADVRGLLREADAALYAAKEGGRDRWELFDDEMRRQALERLELTNSLRQAVEAGQLRLVWQPILPLQDDEAGTTNGLDRDSRRSWVSLEALVRWTHPTLGEVPPDRFIPLAEETGLIVRIGEWVLWSALEQLAAWRTSGPETAPDLISVNLSARQLAQRNIVETVRRALDDTGVEPERLALEITETAVLADPTANIRALSQLRELGVHLAIDDFGTGYSSLAYLRDLPVDAVKIDRSFVARLATSDVDDHMVRSIVTLAHGFDLAVIGEGVETDEQRRLLVAMGCDRGQGYLWARPLDADDVPGWIGSARCPR